MQFTVSSLWRYPVKSMAGEEVQSATVTVRGLTGDRAYALIDSKSRKVGSAKNAKRFGELLRCTAQFVAEPEADKDLPPVRITLSDGTQFQSDAPEAERILRRTFGPDISLVSSAPEDLILEIAAGTLGGKYSQTTELPVSSGAPAGTLFNYATIHIVATSTLRELGHAAASRFRPNIIIDTGGERGFIENDWVGKTITAGPQLQLRVSIPCPRCVVPTLPRTDLPHDPGILRTIADSNNQNLGDYGNLPCVGVYADVVRPGRVSRGDQMLADVDPICLSLRRS